MTAQVSETLLYNDETLPMCANPLESYFVESALDIRFAARTTACSRGYVGTWEVVSSRFYLIGLKDWLAEGRGVGLETVFPGQAAGVLASWFTGDVRCPRGGILRYVHGGYASRYEEDLFLTFEQGVLTGERIVKNGVADPAAPVGYMITASTKF